MSTVLQEASPRERRLVRSGQRRRPYRSPELVVWGRIEDLTQGPGGSLRDFPLPGYRNAE